MSRLVTHHNEFSDLNRDNLAVADGLPRWLSNGTNMYVASKGHQSNQSLTEKK